MIVIAVCSEASDRCGAAKIAICKESHSIDNNLSAPASAMVELIPG